MGLVSETRHDNEAQSLEKVLLNGIKTNNKATINFLKTNIYPLYVSHVEEAFGAYKIKKGIKKIIELNYGGKL